MSVSSVLRTLPRLCMLLLIIIATPVRSGDRPPVAAIASAHPLATAAGHAILSQGGNAFDAAIAVTAALAVVEPYSSGLGGGGFYLLQRESGDKSVMLDARERAPLAATRDMYLDAQGAPLPGASIDGPRAAGIPGIPAALVHLAEHYGVLPLKKTLAPAIRLAGDGFTIDAHYMEMARFRLDALRASSEASRILLNRGGLPDEGARIVQSDLAATLTALAEHGTAGFYGGKVGKRLVKGVNDAGGIWTQRDLDEYRVIEREPVTGEYRGIHIATAAPPSSGGMVLMEMLNILSGYDLDKLDRVTRVHVMVEAMRRAYRDRAEYLGDPDFTDMPLAMLASSDYAAGLRAGIRLDRATPSAALPGVAALAPGGNHTTHFSILDRDGNRVAATLSINYPFGACFIPPGTGVLLNDEMDDFSIKPGVANVYGLVGAEANAIAPGKRPLSSMTPTFLDSDHGVAILGTPGGSRIITMVLQGLLAFAEGAPVDEWVARPRIHHQYLPDVIQYEPGALTDAEVAALQQRGHVLRQQQDPWGNMQAVFWDKNTNAVSAASDPRGGGESIVER